ncbi:unnamed protein product, partial [Iphiclides podalirius]
MTGVRCKGRCLPIVETSQIDRADLVTQFRRFDDRVTSRPPPPPLPHTHTHTPSTPPAPPPVTSTPRVSLGVTPRSRSQRISARRLVDACAIVLSTAVVP